MNTTTDAQDVPSSDITGEQLAEFFERVRALIKACGPDKNGQAIAVASATIDEGMNTRPQIVRPYKARLQL